MATTSNSSASGNKNKKKRKADQNQKTLGMTWGANSRSSSRSTFNNSPFSDFGSYMALKNQKLHQQFDAEASSSSLSRSTSAKPIFEGISIFVDGYTMPSSQELRGYMMKYGGRFQNYFSRHRVTHIICSNLPDSKIKNLRSFSRGLPVVKPEWVLDSVAADKLLSWVPYQLYLFGSEASNQPKLSDFFSLKNTEALNSSEECTDSKAMSATSNSSSIGEANNRAGEYEAKEHEDTGDLISDEGVHVSSACGSYEQATNDLECENQGEGNNDADINNSIHEFLQQNSSLQESKSIPDDFLDNHSTELSSNSTRPAGMGHSTLSDVNFVQNFFKYSRLHFIGTWRSRYRKRYPTLSSGIKYPSSHDNRASVYQEKVVIHIDMDCFFVSVVTRNHPDLENKPVAVCHSDNPRGTSEISSANYPARDYGIKAGMFVRDAKALCPHLVVVPYDFKAYEEVADQFYDILHKHCSRVQAVSCDEAFMDVTDSGVEDPQTLALNIREEILGMTRCSASAGIASNMLLARVATKIAKPNGQFYIPPEKVDDYLHDLPVKALPGVGRALQEKLKSRQIETCAQMRLVSKESLQKDFGKKTGDMLWSSCRGIDCRLVNTFQESKSIGADVNWGVRFKDMNDTNQFLSALCKEVSLRLQGCGVMGRTFTLKIKKRKADAGEPIKYMGCGDCENLSRSITLPLATDDGDVVERISAQLLDHFHLDPKDIRGMGLQASKLESTNTNKQGHEKKSIRSWLVSSSARTGCCDDDRSKQNIGAGRLTDPCCNDESLAQKDGEMSASEASLIQNATLPSLDELDIGVVESLPPDVLTEIDELYSGKLKKMISKKIEKPCSSKQLMAFKSIDDAVNENTSCCEPMVPSNKVSGIGTSELINASEVPEPNSLMPSSLSQLDPTVLQHLPDDVKADLLGSLPAHRIHDIVSYDISWKCGAKQIEPGEPSSSKNLWSGDPPRWVDDFCRTSCPLLNMLAISSHEVGTGCQLSTIFQHIMPKTHFLDMGSDGNDDSVSCLSELIKQYVEIKVGSDIEEIYACSNILRRLSLRLKIFHEVYESILPHLQVAVGQHYGGTLNVFLTA